LENKSMQENTKTIAIIGGTGALGGGLAYRWAKAGLSVVIGSRLSDKAELAASELASSLGEVSITGTDNRSAAAAADIVVITVPFSHHAAILQEIAGEVADKIVVDATVPLMPPKVGTVQLPDGRSIACRTAEVLGDKVNVVAAFHNVAADKLRGEGSIDCDVLVFGDKKAARQQIIDLVDLLEMRGLHAGPLANSAAAEAMTSVLITINRHYQVPGAGIRITGELTPVETPNN
jgi:NADPH-dependent F420 reductase